MNHIFNRNKYNNNNDKPYNLFEKNKNVLKRNITPEETN